MDPLSPSVSSTMSDTPRSGSSASKHKSDPTNGVASTGKHPGQVQRRNARERNRVRQVNMGFVTLRNHIPSQNSKSKKLSKVDTLRAAAHYIGCLSQMLSTDHMTTSYNNHSAPNLLAQTLHSYDQHQSSMFPSYGVNPAVPSSASGYFGGSFCSPDSFGVSMQMDNTYSGHFAKVSPSTGDSPQNSFASSDNGYDYALSPQEIKPYHNVHHNGDFNVMPSYS